MELRQRKIINIIEAIENKITSDDLKELERYPDLPATKQAELANISPATFRRLRAELSDKMSA